MTTQHELSARASRLIGRVLREKWRLDAVLGIGGMAAVFAATHRNGKRVAVKLMHPEINLDPDTKARFLREGYVANKVGHPGVVSVLDDDTTEDGAVFLVMELLEGETLRSRWKRAGKRLPVDEALRITGALLDVLAVAHEKGIIHRDLKPDNLFLTTGGEVKVLDFGIARLREVSGAVDATRTAAMLGTPAFMAPEQARSRWDWIDARTDLWAVGATLFTILSGELVHEEVNIMETVVAAATKRARPLRSAAPHVPESVAAIVDRALAYEKTERWPDARSMQAAVHAELARYAMPGPPGSERQVASQPQPSRPGFASSPSGAPWPAPPASSPSSAPWPAPPASSPSSAVWPAPPASSPSSAPWPAPPAAMDAVSTPALLTTASGTAHTHSAPTRKLPPRRSWLLPAIGAALALGLGAVTAGVLWLRSGGSEVQAPASEASSVAQSTSAAPASEGSSAPSVTPASEAPSASASASVSAPVPLTSATPAKSASEASDRSSKRDPGRAPVVSKPKPTTPRNPLDKY